jgi:acyl-CoA thioester hydrolase
MPLTHTRTFRVRHYECDTYGHVNHANYLRYMQEAAFDASAAAGYDMARYEAMDHYWLIRETEIEYLRPLRYGDRVEVKTWVADFRRVRSRRAYEFRNAASSRLVAQAMTDWVYLDGTAERPASIPQEMKAAFWRGGAPASIPQRGRFPSLPPPPSNAFRQQRRVEWRDLDMVGHVNNAVYLHYIEDGGIQMAAAHGWPLARMEAEGFAVVARQHQIEYRQPAILDDELELVTWLAKAKESTAVRCSRMSRTRDGALVMQARTVHVWVDLGTGQPATIPLQFLTDLEPITVEGDQYE